MIGLFHKLNLQLFAEGGDGASAAPGGEAAAAVSESGVTAPDAGEQAKQEKRPFSELIKGEYADDYRQEVERTLGRRLKKAKASEERLGKVSGIVDVLAEYYGLEADDKGEFDLDALVKAFNGDETYRAGSAANRNMSEDTYEIVHKLEAEKRQSAREQAARAEQEREAQEEAANRARFEQLVRQAEAAKTVYPSFDLNVEMQNPTFARLVANVGLDAKTAYEVVHHQEIMRGGMEYAAQQTAQKVAASVAAGQRRPVENGLGASAPASIGSGPMSKEQRADYKRRARLGEKVVL